MKGCFWKSKPGETTGSSSSPFGPHFRLVASKVLILPLGWRFLEVGAEIENTAAGFGLLTNHELFNFDFRFSIGSKKVLRPTLTSCSQFSESFPRTVTLGQQSANLAQAEKQFHCGADRNEKERPNARKRYTAWFPRHDAVNQQSMAWVLATILDADWLTRPLTAFRRPTLAAYPVLCSGWA